jgi:hypothetical protein
MVELVQYFVTRLQNMSMGHGRYKYSFLEILLGCLSTDSSIDIVYDGKRVQLAFLTDGQNKCRTEQAETGHDLLLSRKCRLSYFCVSVWRYVFSCCETTVFKEVYKCLNNEYLFICISCCCALC